MFVGLDKSFGLTKLSTAGAWIDAKVDRFEQFQKKAEALQNELIAWEEKIGGRGSKLEPKEPSADRAASEQADVDVVATPPMSFAAMPPKTIEEHADLLEKLFPGADKLFPDFPKFPQPHWPHFPQPHWPKMPHLHLPGAHFTINNVDLTVKNKFDDIEINNGGSKDDVIPGVNGGGLPLDKLIPSSVPAAISKAIPQKTLQKMQQSEDGLNVTINNIKLTVENNFDDVIVGGSPAKPSHDEVGHKAHPSSPHTNPFTLTDFWKYIARFVRPQCFVHGIVTCCITITHKHVGRVTKSDEFLDV